MSDIASDVDHGNILLVDDTLANLRLLAGMLKDRGYKVRPVPSGKLALKAAENDPPDLVLLDINMPEMNGYEVCRQLKKIEKLKDIPVIFISALTETLDKVEAFNSGGVDYVSKPFQFEEVEARVETHLKLRRLQVKLVNQNRQLHESYERLKELETLRDNLVHMIIHDMRTPLCVIKGYLEVIEMTESKNLPGNVLNQILRARLASETLVEMVSSLLDVSRLEEGQMPINPTECDLGAAARAVIARLDALRGQRKVGLAAPELPVQWVCDQDLFSRVLQNLLGNAIKFTPPDGEIVIRILPPTDVVRVSVEDNVPASRPNTMRKSSRSLDKSKRESRTRNSRPVLASRSVSLWSKPIIGA